MEQLKEKEMKIVNDKMNIFEEKTRKTLEENAKNNKLDNDNQINELKKEIKFLRDNLSKKTQQISKLEKNQKVFCNTKQQNDIDNQKEIQTEDCNIIPKDLTDGIFMRLRSSDKIFS